MGTSVLLDYGKRSTIADHVVLEVEPLVKPSRPYEEPNGPNGPGAVMGLDLEVENALGQWMAIATLVPRERTAPEWFDASAWDGGPDGHLRVRVVWNGLQGLDAVRLVPLAVGANLLVQEMKPIAYYESGPWATETVLDEDATYARVADEDVLTCVFVVPEGGADDLMLEVTGYYVSAAFRWEGKRPEGVGRPQGDKWYLEQNRPNPFNPTTEIAFGVGSAGAVDLFVYDAGGRVVRRLLDRAPVAAGQHVATWDGRDGNGGAVGSGVYYVRLAVGDRIWTKKLVLIH